ncbi:MAG: NAD-binding protein [Desulfurococcales archaeon]|nr:NAD-binding protein [Desulfurococcales archaeon]
MGSRVAVVGAGRIGLRAAWELAGLGYDVVVVDSSSRALRRASEVVGSEGRLADASSPRALAQALRDVDYALIALPGGLGGRPLESVVEAGVDAVDVSFYKSIPERYAELASRAGIRVVVDAGVAPGLSNMLVASAYRELGFLEEAYILVGGVSRDPNANPLGLAATWNAEDLIDEYLRPARILRAGEVAALDPLSSACKARIPGVGVMEAFPTDGLRSLLHTMRGRASHLVEYTLRHPGHLDLVLKLRSLGMLSDEPVHVDGCMVRPRAVLARLIEENTSGVEDVVVLAVKASSQRGAAASLSIVGAEAEWSAMARVTGASAVATLRVALEARRVREPGIHYPEELGFNGHLSEVLGYLEARGIRVSRVDPESVLVEECR